MKVIILPGLDGTGALVDAFCAAMPKPFEPVVLRYPVALTKYAELLAWVQAQLPVGDFAIIAESFSGPLTIQLAADSGHQPKAVVFVAAFAKSPRPIPRIALWLGRWLPVTSPSLAWLSQPLTMGRWANRAFLDQFSRALNGVPRRTLLQRLAAVRAVDVVGDLNRVSVPTLYLQALHDRLVPSSAAAPFRNVQAIDGPHFLLQANPTDAAAVIGQFLQDALNDPTAP